MSDNNKEINEDVLDFGLDDMSSSTEEQTSTESTDNNSNAENTISLDLEESNDMALNFDDPVDTDTTVQLEDTDVTLQLEESSTSTDSDSLFSDPAPSTADSLFSEPTPSTEDSLFSEPAPSTEDSLFSEPADSNADSLFGEPAPTTESTPVAETPSDDTKPNDLELDTDPLGMELESMDTTASAEPTHETTPDPLPTEPEKNPLDDSLDLPLSDEPVTAANSAWKQSMVEDEVKPTELLEEPKGKKGKKAKKEKKAKSNKPRKKLPIILASVFGGLLVFVGVLAYLLVINKITSNAILSTALPPKMYYGKVEMANIEKLKDNINKNFDQKYASAKKLAKTSTCTTSTVELGDGAYELAPLLGGTYSDFILGTKSITLKSDLISEGPVSSYIIDLVINDQSITLVNVELDKEAMVLYFQCPAVSKRWFRYQLTQNELEATENSLTLTNELKIKGRDLSALIDRYIILLIDYVSNVTLDKDVTLEADGSKIGVKEAVITFTTDDLFGIHEAVLKEVKKDDFIYTQFKTLGIYSSKSEYTKAIDSIIEDLQETKDEYKKTDKNDEDYYYSIYDGLKMHVYIDEKGDVVGRKFIPKEAENMTFKEMSYIKETDKEGITKYLYTYLTKYTKFTAEGNNKAKSTKNTGTCTFYYENVYEFSSEFDLDSDYSADAKSSEDLTADNADDEEEPKEDNKYGFVIKYKDLDMSNMGSGIITGKLDFSLKNMPAMLNPTASITLSEVDGFQKSVLDIMYSDKKVVTLTNQISKSQQKEITLPATVLDCYTLQTDKLAQYNLLLELNASGPYKGLLTAYKGNKNMLTAINATAKETGIKYFNGSQNAVTLYYLARVNEDIKAIFKEGYTKTKKGLNPGLDAQCVPISTPAEGTKEPDASQPAGGETGSEVIETTIQPESGS